MKKIAQGRERRRDRQLEAAERQVTSTKRHLRQAEEQLAFDVRERNQATGPGAAVLERSVEQWSATIKKLTNRLVTEEEQLRQLRAGNYPT